MAASKFRTIRKEMLADPVFRAEVARERELMAAIDLGVERQACDTRAKGVPSRPSRKHA
jgi:hypothetical protein